MNELLRRALGLPPQASAMAREVDHLHFVVISATMLGATLVALVALWFLARYRRRAEGPTPPVSMPTGLEAALVAGTLGLFLAFWVAGYRQYLRMREPPRGALDVYVTAKQWMWKFARADGSSEGAVLVVPAGRPVRLVMTSRDVIHSFFVPALRLKQDVLPGRYVTAWFTADRPGTYDVFCAEYCGLSHSRMRASVVVLSPEDYQSWLEPSARREPGGIDLPALGREVAVRRQCLACHTVDGQRHIGPTWRGLFGREVTLADGRRVVADEAYLTRSMMDPAEEVVAGFAPVMPTYFGVLDPPEAAALVEYIRSLRLTGPAPSVALPAARVEPDAGRGP